MVLLDLSKAFDSLNHAYTSCKATITWTES